MKLRSASPDVHAADRGPIDRTVMHSPGDMQFLHDLAGNLRASVAMSDAHMSVASHPDVAALASQTSAGHASQLARVDGLRARLATAGATTSASSAGASGGHGQGGGQGGGNGGGAARGEDVRAAKAPYGNVTYADPGYQDDGVKRYPLDSEAHCRAAWSYINMPKNASKYTAEQLASIKSRIKSAGKKYGIQFSDDTGREEEMDFSEQTRHAPRDAEFERSVPFEMDSTGDGWTLEGYAAVFNTPARIRDAQGDFDEVIMPGAFRESIRSRPPVIMFDHGKHPLIGQMPLGELIDIAEDTRGLHIQVRLSDNWLIEPVRDAIRDGGVRGMSFRLQVPDGGERWSWPAGGTELRELTRINTRECGPVVFPAYAPTTAEVRSILERVDSTARTRAVGQGGGDQRQPRDGGTQQMPLSTRDRMLRFNARRMFEK